MVRKYGGSSIATPEKVIAIADRIATTRSALPKLVVVVSAMGKTTDDLVALAHQVTRQPEGRETDRRCEGSRPAGRRGRGPEGGQTGRGNHPQGRRGD